MMLMHRQEAHEGIIKLPEEEPETIRHVVVWLYQHQIALEDFKLEFCQSRLFSNDQLLHGTMPTIPINRTLQIAKVYQAADKFLLPDLQKCCLRLLQLFIDDTLSNQTDHYIEAASYVYSHPTNQELRQPFYCVLHKTAGALWPRAQPRSQKFVDLLTTYPDLARDCLLGCESPHSYICELDSHETIFKSLTCPRGDHHICGGVCPGVDSDDIPCPLHDDDKGHLIGRME